MEVSEVLVKILLTLFLAGLVGWKREKVYKPAGLRTHLLIGLASCIFTICSLKFIGIEHADSSRIIASILIGMGFIGAGTIIKQANKVVGITTAASLWLTTAIGIAIGMGEYLLGSLTGLIGYLILTLKFFEKKFK